MNIDAAVLWEQGKPLTVERIAIEGPGPGEVLVEVKAAGICHSDVHPALGDWPVPVPVVLGHEGAGIVREVGEGVTRVRPGDHVVLCWAPACGSCPPCREGKAVICDRLDKTNYRHRLPSGANRLRLRDQVLTPYLGTACFASHTVVAEGGAIPVPKDVSFEALGTLGCAVVTGVGAVINAARVTAGARVVVIGAGGVGLNVVQGAVLAGGEQVIAIDRRAAPLALARSFGATEILESPDNLGKAVRELTSGRGADYVFDTVGTPATLTDAVAATRKGGTIVVTGLSRPDALASFPMFPFVMQEKRLIGSAYGSGDPAQDIARLVELHQVHKLKLQELVTRTYPLTEINEGLQAAARADGARGIVRW